MDRRRFLTTVTAAAGLGGCVAPPSAEDARTATPTESHTLAELGTPPTICDHGIVDVGIYAIVEPSFADDWADVEIPGRYADDGRLDDDAVVVGLRQDDHTRAYPLPVLWKHEIVNDLAIPAIVTYCSLCRSGMVARPVVDGTPTTFGVSGQLWQPPRLQTRISEADNRTFALVPGDPDFEQVRNTGNLVMFDRATGSYWSQILARAICGATRGDTLPQVPSTSTTWGEWRDSHPDTEVLLPPPHSGVMEPPESGA